LDELGRISGVVHSGAAPIGPAQYAVSGLARMSATSIIKDGVAAAMIQGDGMQTVEGRQKNFDAADAATSAETMRDFVEAIRAKIARLIELFEQIAAGPFSNASLKKNFREQAEAINHILDTLWENAMVTSISAMGMPSLAAGSKPRSYADTGQALTTFKEELEQTSGSGESMPSVGGTTDQINSRAEFGLGQIADIQQKMTERNTTLELGVFSLARLREQAMKTLRSAAPEPDRVLSLLQDP